MKSFFIAAAVAIASLVFLAPPASAKPPCSPEQFDANYKDPAGLAALIDACGVMSADDAKALVDRFTSGGRILREQNGTDFTLISEHMEGSFEVVICNLSPDVRAVADFAPWKPRARGIEPKQCMPFVGVRGLGAVGGRSPGDTDDNGASGQLGWFGVYLYRAMP